MIPKPIPEINHPRFRRGRPPCLPAFVFVFVGAGLVPARLCRGVLPYALSFLSPLPRGTRPAGPEGVFLPFSPSRIGKACPVSSGGRGLGAFVGAGLSGCPSDPNPPAFVFSVRRGVLPYARSFLSPLARGTRPEGPEGVFFPRCVGSYSRFNRHSGLRA
jgi:hypothetical protein